MSRDVSVGLQALLDDPSCETQTTLSLYLKDTTEIHVATAALTAHSDVHTDDLRSTDDIRQSINSTTDRVSVRIQNVDKVFGGTVTDGDLIKAEAVIGRFFRDEQNPATTEWVELFRGEAIPLEVNEKEVVIEVVSDLIAAGYVVGHWPLSENCVFVFKHAGTCGYSGSETVCNKKWRSKAGCAGRSNEHHFGGMEFPEPQIPTVPTGTGDPDGNGFPSCPRLDQFVVTRGDSDFDRVARRVSQLKPGQWLWNPIGLHWDMIVDAEVIPDQEIWEVIAANGAASYSSYSHPILADCSDIKGTAVRHIRSGQPVLTWSNSERNESTVRISRPTGEKAAVMKISLASGHIYCSGNRPGLYIAAHNSKLPVE